MDVYLINVYQCDQTDWKIFADSGNAEGCVGWLALPNFAVPPTPTGTRGMDSNWLLVYSLTVWQGDCY